MEEKNNTAPLIPAEPFVRTWPDRVFALVFYGLGYLYIRTFLDELRIGGCLWTVFTLVYTAAVLSYFLLKGLRPTGFSWFWLCCLLALGLSFSLFDNSSLMGFNYLVLHGLALYWPLCASGACLRGGTSGLIFYDALNAAFIVPYANFSAGFRCVFGGWNLKNRVDKKRGWAVIGGIALLCVLLALILPLLSDADEQFSRWIDAVIELPSGFHIDWRLITAIPVACVLFGLCYGLVNRRHTRHIKPESIENAGAGIRIVPNMTLYIAVGGVCAIYALFLCLQAGHIFSAFAGRLSGTDIYSVYAREGFFELCRVAAINGVILLCANLFSAAPRRRSRVLRVFNIVLAALTLLILASAAGKMLLYIGAYGLTPKRVLTMVFMLMLSVLYGGLIVWQKRDFNLIRLTVCFAAVVFIALCLCDLDGLIVSFNASHGFGTAVF